jgi:MFS superfamily sulfate permease-like transporter
MLKSSTLRDDLSAGFVVFLVALPLCLGIALASGAPFFSGMIAGIVGGVVVGIVSQSHVSVSGPAAGLAAVVLAGITSLGSFEAFLVAVVIAGLIQIAMGILKIGSMAEYFPSSVISGMLTAIGIIIILKQIPHGLGYDHDTAFLTEDGMGGMDDMHLALLSINPAAALICFLSLAILLLWDKPAIKKRVGALPSGLIVVVLGVAMGEWLLPSFTSWNISPEHKVNVPVAASASEFLKLFSMLFGSQTCFKINYHSRFIFYYYTVRTKGLTTGQQQFLFIKHSPTQVKIRFQLRMLNQTAQIS